MDKYPNFETLFAEELSANYRIVVERRAGSAAVIIAPHGGAIEPYTSEIARAIAGETFSFYAFEGAKASNNYADLHITSHHFDEPRALELVHRHECVVAIHGCTDRAPRILIGGRDEVLAAKIARKLKERGLHGETSGHPFRGLEPANICNRGRLLAGVQIELSMPFRQSESVGAFVDAVREALLEGIASHEPDRAGVRTNR